MSKVLESLKSIADIGVQQIKPFNSWIGSPIQDQVWGLWILNVGAVQEAQEAVDNISGTHSQMHALKLEILARSIITVDTQSLATDDDVANFNKQNNTTLTTLQYKLMHLRELEDIVLNRMDQVYAELLAKQARQVQGLLQCELCGKVVRNTDKDSISKYTEYSTSDIVCTSCLPKPESKSDDTAATSTDSVKEQSRCKWCNKKYDDTVELNIHQGSCSLNTDNNL